MVTTAAVIVAAGQGQRAGGGLAKQFRPLAGRRVIDITLTQFLTHPGIDRVVVVLPGDKVAEMTAGFASQLTSIPVLCVAGGTSRTASVRAGLEALSDTAPDHVLIHDVARPCVSELVITSVLDALNTHQAAAPALPLSDALWQGKDGQVSGTPDRAGLFRAQTPQGFHYGDILSAHRRFQGEASDDVAIARSAGIAVAITAGDEDNLKITTSGDFARAERILGSVMDIRTGNGFDVHAFEPGDHVTLCGIDIAHSARLKGHSDADVAMHALTDAIYGALGQGDIGRWFPPSDPKWKGAASDIFLRHAAQLATERGYQISHLDCTIICEQPKIGPHAAKMKARLAEILQLSEDRLSVKATTSEGLGFTGRGEGIAAMATATLVKT